MDKLIEIFDQILELAGIGRDAIAQAVGGESGNAAPEEGAPPPPEEGAPGPQGS